MIKRSSSGELKLYSENKPINTYYIPSNSIEAINDQLVTIVIESKDQVVGIRPKTLGIGLTDEVDELIDDIARYNSTYEDYYLRIRVYSDDYNGKINNEDPSSELVQVEFAVIESRKEEEDMDSAMVNQLDSVIDSNKSELIAKLDEELEKGINDSLLLDIVEDMVDEVEAEYLGLASIYFQGQINSSVTTIHTIDKAIYVALQAKVSPANNAVYSKQNGVWKKK